PFVFAAISCSHYWTSHFHHIHRHHHDCDRCRFKKEKVSSQACLLTSPNRPTSDRSDSKTTTSTADRDQRSREGKVQILWSTNRLYGSGLPVLRSPKNLGKIC